MRQAHKIVNDREARILLLNKKKQKTLLQFGLCDGTKLSIG